MSKRDRYVHGHHESVVRAHSWRTVENSAAYVIPHIRPGMHVLDVGSGPGTITVDLAQRVSTGHVHGIDVEPTMAVRGRAFADSAGVSNVTFATGSGYAIDAPDDSYDLVHAHQVLQHVSDPQAVIAEMLRVAKPGGIVAARDAIYSGATWYPDNPVLKRWRDAYLIAARAAHGDPDIGRRLHALALAAGATDVSSSASIWCFSTPAERESWGQSWAERASESQFAVQTIESGALRADDLQHIAQAWRDWAADERGWFTMPHGEIIATA